MRKRKNLAFEALESRATPSTIGPQGVDTTALPVTPDPNDVPPNPPPLVIPPPTGPTGDFTPPSNPVA